VTSVFLGVYDSTGTKLTNVFANDIAMTISSPSIVQGDVVQAEINGVWQVINGSSVTNGVARAPVGSDPVIDVTSAPGKGASPAGSATKGVHEPTIAYGSVGDVVKLAQEELNKFGAHLVVDGIFGPLTEAATKAFQSAHGLAVDGIIGPLTWKKLL
jgi:peptidoglycan hydrolase-like protein with peptidoglycan-binding domain